MSVGQAASGGSPSACAHRAAWSSGRQMELPRRRDPSAAVRTHPPRCGRQGTRWKPREARLQWPTLGLAEPEAFVSGRDSGVRPTDSSFDPKDGRCEDRCDEHRLGHVVRRRRIVVGQGRIHDVRPRQVPDDGGEPGADGDGGASLACPAETQARVRAAASPPLEIRSPVGRLGPPERSRLPRGRRSPGRGLIRCR
jgi:hypothetical protein